jgi:hypothetical protein
MLMLFVLYKCISQMWCFQQENKIRVFFRMRHHQQTLNY